MAASKRRARTVALTGGVRWPCVDMWRTAMSTGDTASFVDVTLVVDHRKFPGHKLVLGCASASLQTLLANTQGKSIAVPNVGAHTFHSVLTWIYEGACTVDESELPDIIKASALLRVHGLTEAATAAVQERLARAPRTPTTPSDRSPPSPRPAAPHRHRLIAAHASDHRVPPAPGSTATANATTTLGTPRTAAEQHLYILGGLHTTGSAERLDLATGAWHAVSAVPQLTRKGMALASTLASTLATTLASTLGTERSVYAIGGHLGGAHVTAAVDVLDVRAGAWACGPPLRVARAYAAAAALPGGGGLMVVGGHDGTRRLATGEILRSGATSWESIAPMTTARAHFGIAVAEDGTVYVAGGHDGDGYLSACEAYDPASGQWRSIAPLASPRAYHGLACLHGQLFAIGGHDGTSRTATVERYDPQSDTWLPSAPLTVPRAFLATASDGQKLYAIGGSDAPGHSLACAESFEPSRGQWQLLAHPMREPRCFPGAALA